MAYEFACQREPVRFRNEDSFKLMMIALALPQSSTREAVGNELGAYEVFLRRTSRHPPQSGNSTGIFLLKISALVPASAGSVPARFPATPRRSRCRLCPLRCRLRSHRCRLGSRAFHVYPDQISSTPNGSISIDSPELRLHPGNASIPLPRTLRVHLFAIPVQLLQSPGVLGSSPAPAPDLTPWVFPTHAKQFGIRSFENEITIQ